MIDFKEIDKEFKVVLGKGLRPFLIYKKNWQYDAGCTVYSVSEAFEKVKNREGAFFPSYQIDCMRLFNELQKELGDDYTEFDVIVATNWESKEPVKYAGSNPIIQNQYDLANAILGLRDWQDLDISPKWIEDSKTVIKTYFN